MTSPFIHLHTHSEHSLLSGVPSIVQLVRRARELGFSHLALSDSNSTAGLLLFVAEARRQGLQPIAGVELCEAQDPARRLVLLARNATGYGDLCELVTRHLELNTPLPKLFSHAWPHLFALCPHPTLLAELASTPLRPALFAELLCNNASTRSVSRSVESLARDLALPMVAAADVHFLERHHHLGHCLLRAIAQNTHVGRLAPESYAPSGAWLRPSANMEQLFSRLPEALENTNRIALQCRDNLQATPWILPTITVPKDYTPDSWLHHLAHEGLKTNYPPQPKEIRQQAESIQRKELDTIARTGYASYFLMVHAVRTWAAQTFGKGFRQGRQSTIMRGSAANCMTFYNLGASDLDPIAHGLYFERFLNEDRTSPPDADLDFAWDEREHAIRWFFDTWGQERVCILCTTHRFRARGAFREAAKALGYSDLQVTQLMENLRKRPLQTVPPAGSHWLDMLPPEDADLQRIAAWARFLRGRPRFLGQHPGGVLVTDDPIWRHLGCQPSGGKDGRRISQVDMHSGIDFLGLVKFDILGNGSLAVLRDALAQLQEQGEADPCMNQLDPIVQDTATQQLLRSGNSMGVFYLESPAQMRLNLKARAGTFAEIGITSSLIRPAGTAWVDEFVRRRRAWQEGCNIAKPLPAVLEPIIGSTHGILVFQEDVTRICVEVAGLSFAQADRVRKMMNSAHEGEPDHYQETEKQFVAGCLRHSGLSLVHAQELWRRVDSFRGFSFCKSHSLSYAQLSFRCAWLKSHYPAQFMAAVITNGHGYYSPSLYIDEARRMGLALEGLHIEHSRWEFQGKGKLLLPGFLHVRRLSRAGIQHLVQERTLHGPFGSLEACVQRVAHLRPKEWESLILVGAFDHWEPNRVRALARLQECLPKSLTRKKTQELNLNFNTEKTLATLTLPELQDYSPAQKFRTEMELLGYSLSRNHLELLQKHLAHTRSVHPKQLGAYRGKRVCVFGMPMTRRLHRTEKGDLMLFLCIQDFRGVVDCIFWPDSYLRHAHLLESNNALELDGIVLEEQETFSVAVDKVLPVEIGDWPE